MSCFVWSASWLLISILIVHVPMEQAFNISEPGRQTTMYGQYFMAIIPLEGGEPDHGSILQIACVSCSSSQGTGTITLLGGNASESFVANPTTSVPLSVFQPFSSNKTAVLNITSDWDVTVVVMINRSGSLSAFNVFPVASLDMFYPVDSYGLQNNSLSELTIVAVEDKTKVNIKANHTSIHVSALDTGEWSLYRIDNNFIGGEMISNKHLTGLVETRCESMRLGCPTSLHELYPLVSMGTRYTAVPMAGGIPYLNSIFRAIAVWKNTEITVTSGKHATSTYQSYNVTLRSGEMYEWNPDQLTDVKGDKPFLLFNHLEMGIPLLDTAAVMVPPIQQYTSQTLTFTTYGDNDSDVTHFITITSPCQHLGNIWLQNISGKTFSSPRHARGAGYSADNLCGYNTKLESGTYRIGPSLHNPEAVYSAILYGNTGTGLFANILAMELNQVICKVEETEVTLCPTPIPPSSMSTPTVQPTGSVFTTPGKRQASNEGTIIAIVVSIVSFLAAGLFVGCIIYCNCRRRQWRRLDETEYLEDNPIRLQVLNRDGCFK